MTTPIVAIIGLPNTGKSTFFNKVLGIRKALTYPEAGTTRDRAYGLTSWNGMAFHLVDTAGITGRPDSELEKNIQRQTAIATQEADLIIYMVDGKTELGSMDYKVVGELGRARKPVLVAANKIEVRSPKTEALASQYQNLGLGYPFLVSSINGSGIGDLLDAVVTELKKSFQGEAETYPNHLRIAFIGKPNVGKSSLINALIKQERLLVDSKAGTTRSTVEIPFTHKQTDFLLLDTAGIKRKYKQDSDVDAAAAMQSLRMIGSADVVLFVVDGSAEMTVQDQIVAEKIKEQDKPVILLLNKVDLLDETQQQSLLDRLPDYFPQMWWVPVVFTSSKTGMGLDRMLEMATDIRLSGKKEIDQTELDFFLDKTIKERMPGKKDDQRAPKIYNLKQVAVDPPTFKLTVNFPAAFAEGWKRSFEKQFRLKFGFEGVPVIIKYARKQ